MKNTRRIATCLLLGGVCLAAAPLRAQASPVSQVWDDADSWPILAPGDRPLEARKLVGLRVVHKRELMLHTENPSLVDAVFQFDEVVWNGKPALSYFWYRTGDLRRDDQSFNMITQVSDLASMRMWHQVDSAPGRLTKIEVGDSGLTSVTQSGDEDAKTLRVQDPGPAYHGMLHAFVLGLTGGLEIDQKFRMPMVDQQTGTLTYRSYHVAERITVRDVKGKPFQAYDVQELVDRDEGMFFHFYVSNKAPYYLGFLIELRKAGKIYHRNTLKSFDIRK